ncbi:MAG: ABC transporter substrate-binding protein [Gaiellaceae bacterium]
MALVLLAGCGSSAPKLPRGGPTLRLTVPLIPRTLDPAKVADLSSLNVTHELYAGLTRFSGTGVVPDLAESWDVSRGGLVWTFHLRKGIRWSDGRAITAEDFRRAWRRALDPRTKAPLAGPDLGIVRGARSFHATGSGELGVEAPNERTLRVTLQHPVPWFDQLAAYPISFPSSSRASSGPFRLASQSSGGLGLERNAEYWNASAVKPRRIVLTTSTKRTDGILPRGLAPPGLPWIETAKLPTGPGWKPLQTLSVQLLWIVTRRPALADPDFRRFIAQAVGDATMDGLVPFALPSHDVITNGVTIVVAGPPTRVRLTLAYTTQDPHAAAVVRATTDKLEKAGSSITPIAFPTIGQLLQAAGPPPRSDIDLVLLGWSSKVFDAYNVFDLFPCTSAFNVSQLCDHSYDRLMRRAVRTLDDRKRYELERSILQKLRDSAPAVPLSDQREYVLLKPGVRGFSWSPLGFYELMGMTRS